MMNAGVPWDRSGPRAASSSPPTPARPHSGPAAGGRSSHAWSKVIFDRAGRPHHGPFGQKNRYGRIGNQPEPGPTVLIGGRAGQLHRRRQVRRADPQQQVVRVGTAALPQPPPRSGRDRRRGGRIRAVVPAPQPFGPHCLGCIPFHPGPVLAVAGQLASVGLAAAPVLAQVAAQQHHRAAARPAARSRRPTGPPGNPPDRRRSAGPPAGGPGHRSRCAAPPRPAPHPGPDRRRRIPRTPGGTRCPRPGRPPRAAQLSRTAPAAGSRTGHRC
jgi:hypothetical protein